MMIGKDTGEIQEFSGFELAQQVDDDSIEFNANTLVNQIIFTAFMQGAAVIRDAAPENLARYPNDMLLSVEPAGVSFDVLSIALLNYGMPLAHVDDDLSIRGRTMEYGMDGDTLGVESAGFMVVIPTGDTDDVSVVSNPIFSEMSEILELENHKRTRRTTSITCSDILLLRDMQRFQGKRHLPAALQYAGQGDEFKYRKLSCLVKSDDLPTIEQLILKELNVAPL